MWEVADDVLLAAFAVGDPDAAVAFVRRYQRRVFGLARSIVEERELAEDLAQEAFVRAWRHAASYDPRADRSNPGCWRSPATPPWTPGDRGGPPTTRSWMASSGSSTVPTTRRKPSSDGTR